MKMISFKKALIIVVLSFASLLASCTVPVQGNPGPSLTPAIVTAPPANSPTAVPTTKPDNTPKPKPSPTAKPTPSVSTIPAGIVRNSGMIIASSVVFRKGPDPNSEVLGKLKKGTFVQIVKTNVNAQWHQLKYNDKTGYVNRVYVCLDSSLDGYNLDFIGRIVNCDEDVNVRKEPSTSSDVIGVVKKGTTLSVIPHETYVKDWYQVDFEGQVGFIHADYIAITAKVEDTQLSDLSVTGGSLFPSFSPNESGYVVKASASEVTIRVKANKGVNVSMNGTSGKTLKVTIPSAGMKTVRISLDGTVRYSVYIARKVLTVGTWNIKRGNGHMLAQGRLVYDQQPDMMGIQETYRDLKASNIIDNLASLKTKEMCNSAMSTTINYSGGRKYGIGMLSRYKLTKFETFPLYHGKYEKRVLQRAIVKIGSKTVSFYNTHFDQHSAAVRGKQFAQVLDVMSKDTNKYKILTGDFNAKFSEFAVFKNYTVVNTDKTKYYDYSKKLIAYSEIDNIIVTKNIKVINTRLVVNSFSDHYPVFAYLILN